MTGMPAPLREVFPTGRTLAHTLTLIAHGDDLPDHGDDLPVPSVPSAGSLILLPRFAAVTFNGHESIDPILWDTPTVVFVPDGREATLTWRVHDHTLAARCGTVTVTAGGHTVGGDPPAVPARAPRTDATAGLPDGLPVLTPLPWRTPADLAGLSDTVRRDGRAALFGLLALLRTYTLKAVEHASRRVYREINDLPENSTDTVPPVLDRLEQEAVADGLLLGADGDDSSVATRLLHRAAAAATADRAVSVHQYIGRSIWSAAETRVRTAIGDPHTGRVIRAIARRLGTTDPDLVLAAVRAQRPGCGVGPVRVQAALTAGPSIHARHVPLTVDHAGRA